MTDRGRCWRDDERGVSTTLSYALTLAVTAILITGLLIAGGTMVEDQRERIADEELSVAAEQLASGLTEADRLGDTVTDGTVRVRVWLPDQIAGSAYNIELENEPTPDAQPAKATITTISQVVDAEAELSLRTGIPIANRTIIGGPVVIEHRDADSDGDRELIVNESGSLSPTSRGPVMLNRTELVFVDPGTQELSSVAADGTVTRYGVNAKAIGPKQADLDTDGLREIPYVDNANRLRIIDSEGEVETLATDAAYTPLQADYKTLLTVGEWRGEISVFYLNVSDTLNDEATIYRVSVDGTPEQVIVNGSAVDATAISGIADLNGDGDRDLVFLGDSQGIHYIDDGAEHYTGQDVGTNNGAGIGEARVFASGESPNVPYVDGSNELHYYPDRTTNALATDSTKSPVASIDWAGNETLEMAYVSTGDNTLKFVYRNNGTVRTINDSAGDPITADNEVGTA